MIGIGMGLYRMKLTDQQQDKDSNTTRFVGIRAQTLIDNNYSDDQKVYPYLKRLHSQSSSHPSHPQPFNSLLDNIDNLSVLSRSQLEYQHKSLAHEYCSLQNYFQIYSKQTYSKIAGLQQQIDDKLSKEQKQIKQLKLTTKNHIERIQQKDIQIIRLQREVDRQRKQIKECELNWKNSEFSLRVADQEYHDLCAKMEKQGEIRNEQNQSLKQALNIQRIKSINELEIRRRKQDQIAHLNAEISSLNNQLKCQIVHETEIRDINHRLKQEVEELRQMVDAFSCEKCPQLQQENTRLNQQICSLMKQKNSKRGNPATKGRHSPNTPYLTIQSHNAYSTIDDHRQDIFSSINSSRLKSLKQNDSITQTPYPRLRANRYKNMVQIKQSIVQRCRSIIQDS